MLETNEQLTENVSDDFGLITTIKKSQNKQEVDKATMALWDKYYLLRVKDKNALRGIAKENGVSMESEFFDDYEEDCYEYFQKAIKSVDIDRPEILKMKSTWQFWLQFHRYLMCYNRTVITAAKNKHKHVVSEWISDDDNKIISRFDICTSTTNDNPYDNLVKNEISRIQRKSINEAIGQFTPIQKNIWNLREIGTKTSEISVKLNISNKDVKDNLNSMKHTVEMLIAKNSRSSKIAKVPQRKKHLSFEDVVYETTPEGIKIPKINGDGKYKTIKYEYTAYEDDSRY